jgi:hypothetical protein
MRERQDRFSRLVIATGDVASPEIQAFAERTRARCWRRGSS